MLRAVLMPKGTPNAAVAEMRKAFVDVSEDKDFRAEYKRIIKIDPEMVSAQQGEELFASMRKVKPETSEVLKKVAVQK
jgi:tripartite-type tricarboxylate transporter receptor subunit TctC